MTGTCTQVPRVLPLLFISFKGCDCCGVLYSSVKGLKLGAGQSLAVAYKRLDPYADTVPAPTPEALAALQSGYTLPVHFGLEVVGRATAAQGPEPPTWNELTGASLAEDAPLPVFLDALNIDILKAKPDMTLGPASEASGRGSAASSGAGSSALPFSAADLVTPEAYQQLFQLLTVDDDIGQAAWEIVQLLPTNRGKLDQLRSIEGATKFNWMEVLDTTKPYAALYSLQIIDAFLHNAESPAAQRSRNSWVKTFVQMGGPQHLVHMLATVTRKRRHGSTAVDGDDGGRAKASEDSAKCSILAHCCRILQAVLSLDPSFVDVSITGVGGDASRPDVAGENVRYSLKHIADTVGFAAGRLVTSVDLPVVVKSIIDGMLTVAKFQRTEARRKRAAHQDGTGSVDIGGVGCSVAVYGMHLITSCVLSRAECLQEFCKHPRFKLWLSYYTVKVGCFQFSSTFFALRLRHCCCCGWCAAGAGGCTVRCVPKHRSHLCHRISRRGFACFTHRSRLGHAAGGSAREKTTA